MFVTTHPLEAKELSWDVKHENPELRLVWKQWEIELNNRTHDRLKT